MSVQHANRGIIKKDLQLYYNREFLKSFRGESSANLLTYTDTYAADWSGYCGVTTNITYNTTDIVDPFGGYGALKVVRNGINTCYGAGAVAMGLLWAGTVFMVAGQTYTMSFYARGRVGGETLRFGLNDTHVSGYYINLTTSWVRYSITFTNITDTSRGFQFISDLAAAGETYYLYGPQTENKSYATPYMASNNIKGSRAETVTNLYSADPYDGFDFVTVYNYVGSTGATISVDTISNPINAPTVLKYTTGSGGYVYFALTKTGLASGTYTVSYYARLESGGPSNLNNAQLWRDNVTDLGVQGDWNPTFYTYWKRFRTTASVTSGTLHFFPLHSGSLTGGFTVYYTGFQLESGDRAKSFTPSSVTANTVASGGGLLDISGNGYSCNLTSSAVLFDSGGYYFNADAVGPLTTPVANSALGELSNNTHTYEIWVKLLGNPPGASDGYLFGRKGYHEGIMQYKVSSNIINAITWYSDNTNSGLSATLTLNTWLHIVYVANVETATRQLYVNGALIDSNTLTKQLKQYASGDAYYLGAADTSYSSNSIVSSAKAYNRALTAAEVLQNFNATRKTYGV